MMIRDLYGHAPAGVYVVTYDGDGILSPTMSDIKSVRRGVGRMEVEVQPSTVFNNGFFLVIERTNPADPIRNIRVIMPGFEHRAKSFPFHPWYLQSIEHYRALRFMDWSRANVQQSGSWAHRTKVNDRTYAGEIQYNMEPDGTTVNSTVKIWRDGVPIELMVRLANEIGADPWFTVPYNADDDFVREMAGLVLSTLRKDVKVRKSLSSHVLSRGSGVPGVDQRGMAHGVRGGEVRPAHGTAARVAAGRMVRRRRERGTLLLHRL